MNTGPSHSLRGTSPKHKSWETVEHNFILSDLIKARKFRFVFLLPLAALAFFLGNLFIFQGDCVEESPSLLSGGDFVLLEVVKEQKQNIPLIGIITVKDTLPSPF
ncbi:hypothetical protein AVEN_226236-1 [Araneus ventricosus]|uniref:Uncharacterized protein n=1 Tax=Araneus ventricosus TaxID=182803 RepID=A0A4Y2P390_ARAVE|nr:hypothetical protein AVEN_226236-1 [Araneus ventricosus]